VNETLKRLQDGIAGIRPEDVVGPKETVAEGETVIGELTDPELQKLFTFHGQCIISYNKIIAEFRHQMKGHSLDQLREHNLLSCPNCLAACKATIEEDFVEAVGGFFWAAVEASLTTVGQLKYVSDQKGIGIRQGWKIVIPKESASKQCDFMMGISGPVVISLAELLRGSR
jgi:hypothetical protein